MIRSFSGWRMLAGVAASALLLTLYARGGAAFLLGFIALVPWMLGLQACQGWRGTLLGAWAMTIAFVLAVFGWFAFAIALSAVIIFRGIQGGIETANKIMIPAVFAAGLRIIAGQVKWSFYAPAKAA